MLLIVVVVGSLMFKLCEIYFEEPFFVLNSMVIEAGSLMYLIFFYDRKPQVEVVQYFF
jgi:hypothetical protein